MGSSYDGVSALLARQVGQDDSLDPIYVDPVFNDNWPDGMHDHDGCAVAATTSLSDGLNKLVSPFLQVQVISIASDAVVGEVAFAPISVDKRQADILVIKQLLIRLTQIVRQQRS